MAFENFDDVAAEALGDKDIRTAAEENGLRRRIGQMLEAARQRRGISIRALARKMGSSLSQVQRVLHEQVGGSLTLRTVVRAADALDLEVNFSVHPRGAAENTAWIAACEASGWGGRAPRRTGGPVFGVMRQELGTGVTFHHTANIALMRDETQAEDVLPYLKNLGLGGLLRRAVENQNTEEIS